MIKKYQQLFNAAQVCLDALSLLVAYALAVLFKLQNGYLYDASGVHVFRPLWMIVILMCTYHLMGLYTPMRSRFFRTEALMVARAHLIGFLAIFAVLFIDRSRIYSREVYLLFVSLSFLSLVLERFVVRRVLGALRGNGYNQKHMLVVGAGALGAEFLRKVLANRRFGYNVIGFLDDRVAPGTLVLGTPVLGETALLPELLERLTVDEVVVASPFASFDAQGRLMDACEKACVRVCVIPEENHFLSCYTSQVENLDGIPLLSVRRLILK